MTAPEQSYSSVHKGPTETAHTRFFLDTIYKHFYQPIKWWPWRRRLTSLRLPVHNLRWVTLYQHFPALLPSNALNSIPLGSPPASGKESECAWGWEGGEGSSRGEGTASFAEVKTAGGTAAPLTADPQNAGKPAWKPPEPVTNQQPNTMNDASHTTTDSRQRPVGFQGLHNAGVSLV